MKQDFDFQAVPSMQPSEPARAEPPLRPDGLRTEDGLVTALALEFWRMRRGVARIVEASDELVPRSIRQSLDRIDDLLDAHGLEFRTHDGQPYSEGSTLEVVYAREKGGDLAIVETLQPTILRAGRIILNGQVILGAAVEEGETGGV